jgi:uncharacterized protein (DUF4415 family)
MSKLPTTGRRKAQPDAETLQFMADLEQGLKEAKAGVYAAVHTPAQILARRRGRPVGSVQAVTKEPVKMRATGDGWQTRINDTLRASLQLAGRV